MQSQPAHGSPGAGVSGGAPECGLNMLRSPSWPPLKTSTGRPKRQGATDGGEATGLGGDAAGERCGGGKGGGGCDDGRGCPAAATRTRTRSSDGTKLMVRCQTVTNAATATRGTQRGRLMSRGRATRRSARRLLFARTRGEYLVNIVLGRGTAQKRVTGGRWRRIVLGDVLARHVVEPRGSTRLWP